jgi:hypothetical protein
MKIGDLRSGQKFYVADIPEYRKILMKVDDEGFIRAMMDEPKYGIQKDRNVLLTTNHTIILAKRHRHRNH